MQLHQVGPYRWRIPRHGKMRTDGLVFATEAILSQLQHDRPWNRYVTSPVCRELSGPPWRCPISTGVRFPDRGRGRQKAARDIDIFGQLNKQGIILRASERSTAAEEIPEAYKDVADVVHILEGAGLGKIVARLVPLAVIKG